LAFFYGIDNFLMASGITSFNEHLLTNMLKVTGFRVIEKLILVVFFFILLMSRAYSFEWQFRPNFSMSEVFSDNLNLSENTKTSGLVTEMSPGVILRGQSPWSNLNLNYRLQGLYNAEADNTVNVHQQLQMNSLFQAIPNTLYLDTKSTISQQNLSNTFIATDNISGKGSIVNNENISISPYLTPHFGQYAVGLLKAGYAGSFFDNNQTTILNNTVAEISNSDTITKQAKLSSGAYFNVIRWNMNYSSQVQNQVNIGQVRFQEYTGDASYFINRKYSVFVQTGYEDNFYQTGQEGNSSIKNGMYYTVGGIWQPGVWYSLEAGYGNNSHVTMRYNPSSNLTANVTYNDRSVGLNLGSTWDANLTYSSLFSKFNAEYHQDTITVQQILSAQSVFPTGVFGAGSQSAQYAVNLPTLINDILIRKHASVNYNYNYGKNSFYANAFSEHRSYQINQIDQMVYGVSGGWQWQFQPRTSFYVQPYWQTLTSNQTGGDNKLYEVQVGLTRNIPIEIGMPLLLKSTLEGRHIKEISGTSGSSYDENRVTANFFVQY